MDNNYAKRLFYVFKEHLAINGEYSEQIKQYESLKKSVLFEFEKEIEAQEPEILEELERIERDLNIVKSMNEIKPA